MSKYIYGKPKIDRVFGVGDMAEEWIDIRRPTYGDAEKFNDTDDRSKLVVSFFTDWSISDGENKVEISVDVFRELPLDITLPALERFNANFLPLVELGQKNAAKSKN